MLDKLQEIFELYASTTVPRQGMHTDRYYLDRMLKMANLAKACQLELKHYVRKDSVVEGWVRIEDGACSIKSATAKDCEQCDDSICLKHVPATAREILDGKAVKA